MLAERNGRGLSSRLIAEVRAGLDAAGINIPITNQTLGQPYEFSK